jgi:vitamin B12 transporter
MDPLGAVIPGARVTLMTRSAHLRRTAVTDDAGVGTFDRVAPGEYLIEVDATGFTRPEPMQVFVEAGEQREVPVAVAVAGVNDYVVVTASGTAQRVGELSKAAPVVDRSEMGARDDRTIADALRTVPGLRIQQLGGLGAATSINVRGLRNEDTAVLIDGMRFRDAGATQGDASTFLSDLLITNVDRVEILRGSGSSLHGSHAIGGVLNVITQSGAGPLGGNLLVESGGLGTTRGHASLGGGLARALGLNLHYMFRLQQTCGGVSLIDFFDLGVVVHLMNAAGEVQPASC